MGVGWGGVGVGGWELPRQGARRWIAMASASELDLLLTVTLEAKSLSDVFPELYLD